MSPVLSITASIRATRDRRGDRGRSLSIVVPALNEAGNLPALVRRIDVALATHDGGYEIIVVDDNSQDGTPGVVAELAREYPVRLVTRERPVDGLGGAVLEGFRHATGEILVVMDADLQHPPERLPDLVAPLLNDTADFVVGSRYMPGGTTAERWGAVRKINSWVATALARPFAGRVRDPMSGFFALRREALAGARRILPLGYKIGLELMCKTRARRVVEVPIHFGLREAGRSKLCVREQFRYLEHLSRLYDFCFPRLAPMAKFAAGVCMGWAVAFAAYLLMLRADIAPGIAIPAAWLANAAVIAVLHLRYVRVQRSFLATKRPWVDFWMTGLAEFATCSGFAAWLLYRGWRMSAAELFVFTFAAATITRYVLRKELLQDIRGLRQGALGRHSNSGVPLQETTVPAHPDLKPTQAQSSSPVTPTERAAAA